MKKLIVLMVFAAGCGSKESGLSVTVKIADGVTSTHAQVIASGGGEVLKTKCIAIAGKKLLDVGVVQGPLPAQIALDAQGFSDDRCATPTVPTEVADTVNAVFVKASVTSAQLVLRNPNITSDRETNCVDGLDDDQDGTVDCADDDCDLKACTTGNACAVNQTCINKSCQGGEAASCTSPPECRKVPGACAEDAGCQYAIAPGGACNGGDRCNVGTCDVNGACVTTPIVCTSPPAGQCFKAIGACDGDGGCRYEGDVDAGCSDGDSCTVDDRCDLNAACSGRRVMCPPRECGTFSNSCSSDGQCVYASTDAGSPCSAGGTCSTAGACVPVFVQPPSNIEPIDFPAPSSSAVSYGCGVTIINSNGLGAPTITNGCSQAVPGWGNVKVSNIDVLVLSYASLAIQGSSTLKLTGSRPVLILSMASIDVLGAIQVEAGAQACVNSGAGPNGSNSSFNSGAGGGGFATVGGRGGGVNATSNHGVAGGGVSLFGQLRGGCPGGVGSLSSASAAPGGGALQLSARLAINLSGSINAPGFGGPGGEVGGGNGGGSGGMIVLEGERIIASAGSITCNGGAGGQGGTSKGGQAGTQSTMRAAGGTGGVTGLNTNASGGRGASVSSTGEDGEDGNFLGGGGGGGVGKIQINAGVGCNIGPATTVTISPPAESNLLPDAGCTR